MDHMLTLFAKHGNFDLSVKCDGDINVDDHHTVEDIGICLGKAFAQAAGDFKGIKRYAHIILPMDEALILTAMDISGRSYISYELGNLPEKVGTFDTELVEEFWFAFVRESAVTLHFVELAGANSHHIIEGVFKSAGREFRQAVALDAGFEVVCFKEKPDFVIGQDAMYYHPDSPGLRWNGEAQPFGYSGVTALFREISETLKGRDAKCKCF